MKPEPIFPTLKDKLAIGAWIGFVVLALIWIAMGCPYG